MYPQLLTEEPCFNTLILNAALSGASPLWVALGAALAATTSQAVRTACSNEGRPLKGAPPLFPDVPVVPVRVC